MMVPRVSVIIVSYRSREALEGCLPSLAECAGRIPLEVIVVDNASGDGTAEWLRVEHPQVQVIQSGTNDGYGRGVNLGIQHARGAAFLVLNPDTLASPAGLERLCGELESDARIAAVAPALRDAGGRIARSCGRFPTLWSLMCDHLGFVRWLPNTALFGGYKYGERRMDSLRGVDWVSGAAMLISRTAWERIGGFDRNIFMYMEEVDWCRRASAQGFGIRYLPWAVFVHYGQRSSAQVPTRTYLHNLRARVYYFRKHHGALAAAVAQAVLLASLACKWTVTAMRGGFERAQVYALGMRAVWESPQERLT